MKENVKTAPKFKHVRQTKELIDETVNLGL